VAKVIFPGCAEWDVLIRRFDQLDGDTTDEDWVDIVGIPYTEYVAEIVAMRESGVEHREYLFRDDFPAPITSSLHPGVLVRDVAALFNFYSNTKRAAVGALEFGGIGLISKTVGNGLRRIEKQVELRNAMALAVSRFGSNLSALDHGCGNGRNGLCLMAMSSDANVVLRDCAIPTLRVTQKVLPRVFPECVDRVQFSYAGEHGFGIKAKYGLVWSEEVLEHVPDPFGEIKMLARLMYPGAILYLGTFFDDLGGLSLAHLSEHNRYQERSGEAWFDEVRAAGFRDLPKTVNCASNGVVKLFERV